MEDLPAPKSRIERFLAKACGMDVTTPEPGPGIEPFLYAIAYNTTPPVAGYRTEEWLAYVQGVTPAKPLELEGSCIIGNQKVDVKYFAVAAGMPGATLPEKPQNRKEEYWEYIATHRPTPGVLKYATGTNITLTDVVRGIEELQYVYGDTFQQTYSGKNLAPLLPDGTITTSQTLTNGVITIKQLYSYNKVLSCQNGVINGKPLENTGTYYIWTYTVTGLKPNTAYTVSSDFSATMAAVGNVIVFNIVYSNLPIGTTTGRVVAYRTTDENGNLSAQQVINASIDNGQTTAISLSNIQIEEGATATPYEPYVGGIPAPNPDYPQDVQVVTGEQSVWVHGKNLFDAEFFESATYTTGVYKYTKTNFSTGTTYTRSATLKEGKTAMNGAYVYISNAANPNSATISAAFVLNGLVMPSKTITFNAGDTIYFQYYPTTLDLQQVFDTYNLQVELGSTATTYEPYQGATYTVDLGSTELCKIGTYQDYIYKSGSDWYVHKAFAKLELDGSENWMVANTTSLRYPFGTDISGVPGELKGAAISDTYIYDIASGETNVADANKFTFRGRWAGDRFYFMTPKTAVSGSTAEEIVNSFKTFLSGHPTKVYFTHTTATDTQITDATLIGQLNAIDSAVLPKPIAYITVGATDPNLPGPLKISYYGEEE